MNRAETLLQLARLCRGDLLAGAAPATLPSGASALDAVLPGGGWRAGSVVELMPTDVGIGELRLLAPTLAALTRSDRYVAFVAPPFVPFAPALSQQGIRLERLLVIDAQNHRDILWSLEQILRCRSFGAALGWPATLHDRDIRKLQLAAEAGGGVGFLYRSPEAARSPSPAAARLKLCAGPNGSLVVDILKCRGARSGMQVICDLRSTPGASSALQTQSSKEHLPVELIAND